MRFASGPAQRPSPVNRARAPCSRALLARFARAFCSRAVLDHFARALCQRALPENFACVHCSCTRARAHVCAPAHVQVHVRACACACTRACACACACLTESGEVRPSMHGVPVRSALIRPAHTMRVVGDGQRGQPIAASYDAPSMCGKRCPGAPVPRPAVASSS